MFESKLDYKAQLLHVPAGLPGSPIANIDKISLDDASYQASYIPVLSGAKHNTRAQD